MIIIFFFSRVGFGLLWPAQNNQREVRPGRPWRQQKQREGL